MKTDVLRILACDDEPATRELIKDGVQATWGKTNGVSCIVDVCSNITRSGRRTETQVPISEVGNYDAVILDILWKTREAGGEQAAVERPDGVKRCEWIRKAHPRLPIVIYSHTSNVEHLQALIPYEIDGFVSKTDPNMAALVATIGNALTKRRTAREGGVLYKEIEAVVHQRGAWQRDAVHSAAGQFWAMDSSHGKWKGFWDGINSVLQESGIRPLFREMKQVFEETDLFNLGIMPGMRGHLEHVIYVYFTGYTISHRYPELRQYVGGAAQKILGPRYRAGDDAKYWDAFQLAWLACATLHDTAYCLEIIPSAASKVAGIMKKFDFTVFDGRDAPLSAKKVVFSAPHMRAAKRKLGRLFKTLYTSSRVQEDWIFQRAIYEKRGQQYFNHGVISALRFLSEMERLDIEKDVDGTTVLFLQWACLAMALHSLKMPGPSGGVRISLKNDPLAFLLLLCDEIQVWNRERPDHALLTNYFSACDLARIQLEPFAIRAELVFQQSSRFAGSERDALNEFANKSEDDQKVLRAYLDPRPFHVEIEYKLAGRRNSIGSIALPSRK